MRPTQLNTNTNHTNNPRNSRQDKQTHHSQESPARSRRPSRHKDTHAHYTNLKQHTSPNQPTNNMMDKARTRLRDVLPQNPNRVRDPQAPPKPRTTCTETVSLKDDKRAVDTPKQNIQSIHTRYTSRQPHGCQARTLKRDRERMVDHAHRRVGTP